MRGLSASGQTLGPFIGLLSNVNQRITEPQSSLTAIEHRECTEG
jgi:hypothetical protein